MFSNDYKTTRISHGFFLEILNAPEFPTLETPTGEKTITTANFKTVIFFQNVAFRRHDPDGSYTYGFEGSDGSFKIETKTRTGEVTGKYGYVDDSGKLRVVEYGANELGFQPSGEGITVPEPATSVAGSRGQDDGSDAPESPRPVNGASAKRTQRPAAAALRDESAFFRQPTPPVAVSRPGRPALRSFYRPAVPESFPGPRPGVDGEETPVPAPGSYRTVQEFGDRTQVSAVAGRSYQTVEDYQEPPTTERPTFYRPAAGSPRRSSAAAARRRSRTGGVLDRSPSAERYASPESGASFGLPANWA